MTDSEKLDAVLKKLDAVLPAVTHLTDQVIRLDQNQILQISDAEANKIEDAKFRKDMRARLTNIERAVVELAKDGQQTRKRVEEVDDDADRRLKLVEGVNGHG